jgi:hypothetical protein
MLKMYERRQLLPRKLGISLVLLGAAAYGQAPNAYTVVETNAMMGAPTATTISRDGSMAVIQQEIPPHGDAPAVHMRSLYNLATKKNLSWDPTAASIMCSSGTFGGDWGDPFVAGAETKDEIAKQNGQEVGTETINSMAAKVMTASEQGMSFRVWIETKTGLVLRLEMTPASGEKQTLIDVKQLSLAKPAASEFAPPPACAEAFAAPPPPTAEERIAADTGGPASNFIDAMMPPAEQKSCSAVVKVVKAGSMTPITGFRANVDNKPVAVQNGVVRIADMPEHFTIDMDFGAPGGSMALIYRKCPFPESLLLHVVKNAAKMSDGGEWLWVKSGKYAK